MRTSLLQVILLFLIGWFAAELFVVIEVAGAIGIGATILLLILSWPLGVWALRTQGRAAWRRLSEAVAAGRSPGREVLDGALILIGGLLLFGSAAQPYDVDSTATDVDQAQLRP